MCDDLNFGRDKSEKTIAYSLDRVFRSVGLCRAWMWVLNIGKKLDKFAPGSSMWAETVTVTFVAACRLVTTL